MTIEPTRRSVIKTGAWTAPIVVVATGVPAMAASGTARMSATVSAYREGALVYIDTQITNAGLARTTSLTATMQITADSASRWGDNASAGFPGANDWGNGMISGSGPTRTFSFQAQTQQAPNTVRTDLGPELRSGTNNVLGQCTLVLTVNPGNGSPVSVTTTFNG